MAFTKSLERVNAILLITLVIAVIANLALLGHTTHRIRFSLPMVVVTIGGFSICSFLLIRMVALAPKSLQLPSGENRTFSQAYYYAILAAAVYFILASMLIATVTGVDLGRYSREFKLSMAQRTLMIQVMFFLGYLLTAGAVYSRIEKWEYLDAVYFIDVTLFTIGFGDLSPKAHLGRGLFFSMAIGGILVVGLVCDFSLVPIFSLGHIMSFCSRKPQVS